jgi:hypothetical protein
MNSHAANRSLRSVISTGVACARSFRGAFAEGIVVLMVIREPGPTRTVLPSLGLVTRVPGIARVGAGMLVHQGRDIPVAEAGGCWDHLGHDREN